MIKIVSPPLQAFFIQNLKISAFSLASVALFSRRRSIYASLSKLPPASKTASDFEVLSSLEKLVNQPYDSVQSP